MFDKPGPDHVHNCSPVQYLGIYPRLYLLVVRARLIFMFKETFEVALPSLASNVETRVQFVFKDATCSVLLVLCFI